VFTETCELWDASYRIKMPLKIFGFHFNAPTHSSYVNVDVLQAACRQELWLNPVDAAPRGIKNGDLLRGVNDRGEGRNAGKGT
ncbi:molybdopterin dinucleotide binding domain-containing protein, partial [Enterobacter hormaechei]|uniref:molybdopterin dinucleotide binding domain-containing protein n=1 Tax=Enterobacter hormaechei TaxID=158836 RepID=UPI000D964394